MAGIGFGIGLASQGYATKSSGAAVEFIIEVDTTLAGSTPSNQFAFPMTAGTYDVDWGDGNVDLAQTGTQTHTYSVGGVYEIKATGGTRFTFANAGDKRKITEIKQWGANLWTSWNGSFRDCIFMNVTATDAPDLTNCTDIGLMFYGATGLNADFDHWDVSPVTNMLATFLGCTAFNSPLNSWDMNGVTTINGMFKNTVAFNQPLNNWDTSTITDMTACFDNGDGFDQDISSWDINQVTAFTNFLRNTPGLSTANYDALLIGWEAQGTMAFSGTVDFGGSTYTGGGAAETARTNLIAEWGGILDGGVAP